MKKIKHVHPFSMLARIHDISRGCTKKEKPASARQNVCSRGNFVCSAIWLYRKSTVKAGKDMLAAR
jgi:hypothetical protein